jgi:trehalose synthase
MNGLRSGSVMARPGQGLAEVPLETRHFEDLGRYLAEPMTERVRVAQQHAGELLAGRTVWMVNSTALGGGVAQLLRTLLPYWKGAGIDVRWMVLLGSGEFFEVTKRFHNHLQGQPGDGDVLGIEELTTLDRAALYHAGALASLLAPGDVVVLNDPQTAAMSVPLQRAGATVIWSCHIGIDHDNEYSRNAWRCLRPRLTGVRRFVFSRYTSLPEWLGGAETSILTPGIDPGSTKNLPMPEGAARSILQHLGLAAGVPAAPPRLRPHGRVHGQAGRPSHGAGLRRGTGLGPGPGGRLAGPVGPHQGPARGPGRLRRAGAAGDRRAPAPGGPRPGPGRR